MTVFTVLTNQMMRAYLAYINLALLLLNSHGNTLWVVDEAFTQRRNQYFAIKWNGLNLLLSI